MKSNFTLILLFWSCFVIQTSAQVDYTANDTVPEYNEPFRPGINPGNYNNWTDEQIAELAAGNPFRSVQGIGTKSIRPSLPEVFLDVFGYDVRLGAFQYYEELGMEENVCFIGYPNLIHRDTTFYCEDGTISHLFANMYLPIWDGGLNGTPYNDDNYLAAYTYEVVSMYKDYVRFWEIWNEPSLDASNYRATLPPGHPESWWDNDPDPCDLDIQAPVYQYIRMLRVCYDVIKTVDPDAYVTLGGVGYYSFFDVLCRNTDNPVDGSVTPEYPLAGGAYFDAIGIHTYPHFDGSTFFLENGELVYARHSDAAADGIVLAKNGRQAILDGYGYDGVTYPKKEYLITEINVPRKSFQNYLGSAEVQKNFVTKALITSMSNGIDQLHFYNLGDLDTEENADSWFDVMGFYGVLANTTPFNQEVNEAGIAYKTASDFLWQTEWDSTRSADLNLPPTMRGGAVKKENGEYVYVLWAKTEIDNSEEANAVYDFPTELNITNVYKKEWDYSETLFEENISSQGIALTSTPVFFTTTPTEIVEEDLDISDCVETIDGFTYIGQFLDKKYFKSNNALTWEDAKDFCETRGGNLVEINGYAENDFLKNSLSEPVFIGLSDGAEEGTLTWSNGSPLTFNNIDTCELCIPNDDANDYLMLHSWDGKWSYNPSFVAKSFLMEFDCFNDSIPSNNGNDTTACSDPVPGFTFLGELGGKQYFISNGANNWDDSRQLCEAQGGNLVTIDNEVENIFIQGKINEMVHIGLSDSEEEGVLQWVDGTSLTYENFDICNFCGANEEEKDNLVMHPWNGGWSFATAQQNFRSIMERTCEDNGGGENNGGGTDCDANLALNASANQSSTQLGANPSRAVDGNTDGNFWGDLSSSLTNWEYQPWIEVDLGAIVDIDKIEVWNRNDCCSNLFSNYYILVSNTPFTNGSLDDVLAQTGVTNFLQTEEAQRPTLQELDRTGRYIRIQLTGTSYLAVTEIKVFGCEGEESNCPVAGAPCDDNDPLTINDVEDGFCNCVGIPDETGTQNCTSPTNLALNKPTAQSSTLTAAGITGSSAKGVDGNTNGAFFVSPSSASSVAATLNEFQPWWEVDLEENYLIEQINFYNRTDGNDKSENCYVLISDNPFSSSDLAQSRTEAKYEYLVSGLVGTPSEIFPNVEGRYVRIQREDSGYLLVTELEALGCIPVSMNQNMQIPNLLNFAAAKKGLTTELKWMVLKDANVENYEIEISKNNKEFDQLLLVDARAENTPHNYRAMDRNPEKGTTFYRLKVTQKDGAIYFSDSKAITFTNRFEDIYVYPNPANDKIYLTLQDYAGKQGRVEIYNSFGQKIITRDYDILPASALEFELKGLANGVYSFVVNVENYRQISKKFIISKL